jgi:hypothetical protein
VQQRLAVVETPVTPKRARATTAFQAAPQPAVEPAATLAVEPVQPVMQPAPSAPPTAVPVAGEDMLAAIDDLLGAV